MTYIIIVTYNAKKWLDNCLNSINFEAYKAVVVDNNSTDDTVNYIKSKYKQITLLPQNKNLGFGKANNLGISYALNQGAEQVFLLNQDAYLVNDVLDILINFQSKNIEYGVLSPIHINADKTKLDRNFSNYLRYDNNPYFYADFILGNSIRDVYDVPFVNAAGWLISKSCLMTVGGFDPIFFHYGEDDNYCQRLKFHGFKLGIVPKTYLIHDREDRQKPKIEPFSKEYYQRELRKLKVKYANINQYEKANLLGYADRLRNELIKTFLKRKTQKIKNLKAYLELIKQTIPEIERSVELNRKKQPNYLDLN